MMSRLLWGAAGLFVAGATALWATGGDEDHTEWVILARGVGHRVFHLPGGVAADAVRVRLDDASLEVVDARTADEDRATASGLRARRPGAVAAVNGGFFDEAGKPMGLVLARGRITNTLRRADWGVFWVGGDRAGIMHTTDWRDGKPAYALEALQAGPRLVVARTPVKLKPQVARRTVVCVKSPKEVVLLVTEAIDARPLAEWLAREERRGGLGCVDALNLDGGPSSQLSVQAGNRSLEVRGGWPVPNGLVVVPHKGSAEAEKTPTGEASSPAP